MLGGIAFLDSHFARGVEPEKAARLTAWPAPLRRRGFTDSDSVIAAHRLDVDADSLQPLNCPVAVLHGRESVIDAEVLPAHDPNTRPGAMFASLESVVTTLSSTFPAH